MINNIDNEIKDIIGDLPSDIFRPISHQDLIYLLNMHPFIQVINPNGLFEEDLTPKVLESMHGWKIIRYGNDIICSSLGEFVFNGGDDRMFMKSILGESGTDDGGVAMNPPGNGTIVKQTHDTLVEIIDMATNSGWNVMELVDGTPLMKQMLWLLAEEKGLDLKGYQPDEKVEAKAKREQERRRKEQVTEITEVDMIRPT